MAHNNSHIGLIFYSSQPGRLATFYNELIGLELRETSHGPTGLHIEGQLGGNHIAILKAAPNFAEGCLVPVFRTKDIKKAEADFLERNIHQIHTAIEIGEGMQVVTFTDPDGRPFRLIEIKRSKE